MSAMNPLFLRVATLGNLTQQLYTLASESIWSPIDDSGPAPSMGAGPEATTPGRGALDGAVCCIGLVLTPNPGPDVYPPTRRIDGV